MVKSIDHQTNLYDRDFVAWTEQQAAGLRSRQWNTLDVNNLAEEIAALGRSEQRELGSYLQVLLVPWLKWNYQPERRSSSWENTITNCRDSIQDCLEDSPSLQRYLQDADWIAKYYRRACRETAKETQLPLETFPTVCPYLVAELLNADLPE